MQQFVNPNSFVQTVANIQNCYSNETLEFSHRFTQEVHLNHFKDFFLTSNYYRYHKKELDKKYNGYDDVDGKKISQEVDEYIVPKVFGGLFRTYNEQNLEELFRIY